MEEMSEEARVWRVYNDEAERIDAEMVETWRSTLDTLLLFAGLFSAVIATFVTQTTQSLQPDFTQTTAALLTELVSIQRAALTGGNVSAIPGSSLNVNSQFTPDFRSIWLNGLWLVSLGLTLSTALVTGLIKQWLHYYIQDVTGPPRHRACIRQFRYMGLSLWGVSPIIEMLPVLMNISLLLFFAGLILFSELLTGTAGITWSLTALTCVSFLFYLVTSFWPLLNPQCPYKTSLSSVTQLFIKICMFLQHDAFRSSGSKRSFMSRVLALTRGSGMNVSESQRISRHQSLLEIQAIVELTSYSNNPSVPSIALQSLAALHSREEFMVRFPKEIWATLDRHFKDCFYRNAAHRDVIIASPAVCERFARAALLKYFFRPNSNLLYGSRTLMRTVNAGSTPFFDYNELVRIGALFNSERKNTHFTALRMFMISHDILGNSRDALEILMEAFSGESIPISSLHSWELDQFVAAAESSHDRKASAETDSAICLPLIKTLSPDNLPSFQDAIKIRYLHTNLWFTEEGFNPIRDEVSLSTCLVRIVPTLASAVFTNGSRDDIDEMFLFLKRFLSCISPHQDTVVFAFWSEAPVFLELREANASSGSATPNLEVTTYRKFTRLLHQLLEANSLGNLVAHAPTRMDVVLQLFSICHSDINSLDNVHTMGSVVRWLIELCYNLHSGTLSKELEPRLRTFFSTTLPSASGVEAMKALCDCIRSKGMFGLPRIIIKSVIPDLNRPQWRTHSLDWRNNMNALFMSISHSRPDSNLDEIQLQSLEDRWDTLNSLVEFGSSVTQAYSSEAPWGDLLRSWQDSMQQLLAQQPRSGSVEDIDNLNDLIQLLSRGGQDPYSWSGDYLEQIGPASNLEVFWANCPFEEYCFRSAFHALLVSSYWEEPYQDSFLDYLQKDLDHYFRKILHTSGDDIRALQVCCKYLSSKPLGCLPKSIAKEILDSLWRVHKRNADWLSAGVTDSRSNHIQQHAKWQVPQQINELFKLFLERDPRESEIKLPILKALSDRWRTLSDLISFVIRAKQAFPTEVCWGELLSEWDRLLRERSCVLEREESSDQEFYIADKDIEDESYVRELLDLLNRKVDVRESIELLKGEASGKAE